MSIVVGAAVGVVIGLLIHAGFAYVGGDTSAFDQLYPDDPAAVAFGGLGGVLGAGLAAELVGFIRIERVVHLAFGALAGASAGLFLYCVGYVLGNYLFEPIGFDYVFRFVEALYSTTWVQLLCVAVGATVGLLVIRSDWRFFGVMSYIALVSVVAGYLGYAVLVSLPRIEPSQLPVSLLLLLAETASLLLVMVYAFYSLDVSMRRRWRRLPAGVPFSRYYVPKVAFHVTVFNEPAEMVLDTLRAIERIDYPRDRRLVMVLDDSTEAATREPIRAYCAERGHVYLHREDRRGFKAGALNHALTFTPPDAELISVVDADFQIEPDYLRETVGYFVNPNLGFLQTPQDYRNKHQSFLTEQYYHADAYFYRAVLPARNEENAIIFCGTMGVIRRTTLEAVGGWSEECITEDSELSVRILERGYDSLYINKTYGRGLIPPLYEAYKKQLYRWSFGGIQILRKHFRRFLFGRMSLRQKLDFFVGSLHWFDGIFIVIIGVILASFAAGDLAGQPVLTYHQREIWLVGLVPFFLLLDGVTRLHLAMRRTVRVTLTDTMRVLGIWYAIKFNNMFAALKSFAGIRIPFIRTPKAPAQRIGRLRAMGRAIRLARFETLMFLVLFGLAVAQGVVAGQGYYATGTVPLTRAMLIGWMLYYSGIFLCAPVYAYKAYTTFVPDSELFPRREPAAAPLPPSRAGGA